MKKILIFFSLLLTTHALAEEMNAMVLHLASGTELTCMFDERPTVTFEGDELVLTTHMNVMRYQASDVKKFTYTYLEANSINNIKKSRVNIFFDGNILRAVNLQPNSIVDIYTIDGIQVVSAKTDRNGNVSLPIPHSSGMVYVVKTSVANFKISKP